MGSQMGSPTEFWINGSILNSASFRSRDGGLVAGNPHLRVRQGGSARQGIALHGVDGRHG